MCAHMRRIIGNPECRAIWNLLCDISRHEFEIIYNELGVLIEEFGESYYNPMIVPALKDIEQVYYLLFLLYIVDLI